MHKENAYDSVRINSNHFKFKVSYVMNSFKNALSRLLKYFS